MKVSDISKWETDTRIIHLLGKGVFRYEYQPIPQNFSWGSCSEPEKTYPSSRIHSECKGTNKTPHNHITFVDDNFPSKRHAVNKIGATSYLITDSPDSTYLHPSFKTLEDRIEIYRYAVVDFYHSLFYHQPCKVSGVVEIRTARKNNFIDYSDLRLSGFTDETKEELTIIKEQIKEKPPRGDLINLSKVSVTITATDPKEDKLKRGEFINFDLCYGKLTDFKPELAECLGQFPMELISLISDYITINNNPTELFYAAYKKSESGLLAVHCATGVELAPHQVLTFLILDYYRDIFESEDPLEQVLKLFAYLVTHRPCTYLKLNQFIQSIKNALVLHAYEEKIGELSSDWIKKRAGIPLFSDIEKGIHPILKKEIVICKNMFPITQEVKLHGLKEFNWNKDVIIYDNSKLENLEFFKKRDYATFSTASYQGEKILLKAFKKINNSKGIDARHKHEVEMMFFAQQISGQVVKLKQVFINEFLHVGMELIERPLNEVLKNPKIHLSWYLRLSISTEVVQALAKLHAVHFIHGDIRSACVLLNIYGQVILNNFWNSHFESENYRSRDRDEKIMNIHPRLRVNTNRWLGPERFVEGVKETTASDIYSFGVFLWQLVTLSSTPYLQLESTSEIVTAITKGEKNVVPADCPREVEKIIQSCWRPDPAKRPKASELAKSLGSLLNLLKETGQEMTLEKEVFILNSRKRKL